MISMTSRSRSFREHAMRGARSAWVSAPLASWYRALVVTGVVRHKSSRGRKNSTSSSWLVCRAAARVDLVAGASS